jgi:hypothetical protein
MIVEHSSSSFSLSLFIPQLFRVFPSLEWAHSLMPASPHSSSAFQTVDLVSVGEGLGNATGLASVLSIQE